MKKLWVRFLKDYQSLSDFLPSYRAGQLAEIEAVYAEGLIDCQYAVLASEPPAASFRERFWNAGAAGRE